MTKWNDKKKSNASSNSLKGKELSNLRGRTEDGRWWKTTTTSSRTERKIMFLGKIWVPRELQTVTAWHTIRLTWSMTEILKAISSRCETKTPKSEVMSGHIIWTQKVTASITLSMEKAESVSSKSFPLIWRIGTATNFMSISSTKDSKSPQAPTPSGPKIISLDEMTKN